MIGARKRNKKPQCGRDKGSGSAWFVQLCCSLDKRAWKGIELTVKGEFLTYVWPLKMA
jgi:hypothetical protein